MIPTTCTHHFGATFAQWMSVGDLDLTLILPGLGNLDSATLEFVAT